VYPGQKEIGWFPVGLRKDAIADPLFAAVAGSFWALHWHGDVFDLPPDAVSLARSDLTEHQAFRFEKNAYGILFHLEATVAHVQGMATAFAEDLARDGIDGDALVASAREMEADAVAVADVVFKRFAERVSET
jgi:GMP synthase (glutamine-hydrolysing)